MILNFKTKKQESNASARVVDGKLILSLPDALAPVVWQMDLGEAKASALEVKHDEDNARFVLVLKTPRGEKVEVAAFDKRADALEGLMAASAALENASGQIQSGSAVQTQNEAPTQNKKNKRNRWMSALLAVVILFVLLMIWSSVLPRTTNIGNIEQTAGFGGPPPTSSGVPVSADDFLRAQ